VSAVSDNHGSITYAYQYGRVTDLTDSITGNVHYEYDLIGNRTSVRAPNGDTTNYAYDLTCWYGEYPNLWLGLQQVTDPASKTVTYAYYSLGQLQEVVGNSSLPSTYQYDDDDHLTQLETKWGGMQLVARNQYAYEEVGNRLTRIITNPDLSTRTET